MGKVTLLLICIFLSSCSIFEKGYKNKYGRYVPKRSNYKLKDKRGHVLPKNLDINNIYKLKNSFYNGSETYPEGENTSYNNGSHYIKFYPNGRCLDISIYNASNLSQKRELRKSDLDPNRSVSYYAKCYYYSSDGYIIQIECFAYGTGYGQYIQSDYYLKDEGNTLIHVYGKSNAPDKSKDIYKKVEIPDSWNKYDVDW